MNRSKSTSRVRRWLAGLAVLAVVGAVVIPAGSVAAVVPVNPVADWNLNTINAIGNPPDAAIPGLGQPPPPAVIHLAMVQGAVYDAVNAIDGGHQPYLGGLPSMPGASEAAAVATAAHDVLVVLPPLPGGNAAPMRASVDELYRLYMLDIPDGAAKEQGIALGRAAAIAMVTERTDDGRPGTSMWPIGTLPGQWRPVGPNNANVFATTKDIDTFSIKRSDQFRTEGPPDMASAEYAAAFNEVKSTGEKNSPRTDAQNKLASFVSANPFGPFHRALREIALANGLSTADQALLFVKTSVAAADAFIACWDDKDHWLFWRPQTAIQLADTDGNPATVADPNWTALFPNPGYPDQPSGYNCFTAAVWHSAKAFFGTDKMTFSVTSPGTLGFDPRPVTRDYTRFTDVVRDAIDGRILIGYHFRFADVDGAWIGKKVAQWVDKHNFEPVD